MKLNREAAWREVCVCVCWGGIGVEGVGGGFTSVTPARLQPQTEHEVI